MNARDTLLFPKKTAISQETDTASFLHQLSQSVFCVGLGALSGMMSTALVIGLLIILQLSLSPTTTFAPHLIVLTVIAALVSLGLSWLFSRVTPSMLPRLLGNISDREIQIIFTIGVLTSLLEMILFLK